MSANFRVAAASFAAVSFCACSFGPSATEKAEAGNLSRAIDLLREAPNAQKPELFTALQSTSCETPDLCELKRICESGYAKHLSGLRQTAAAKSLLADGGADGEVVNALAAATAALEEAAPQIAQCADAQGAAHRKYKF
ncbi:MAG TPA: hypothetical protein VHV51_24105 [Polyangiaceae bacterium]|nr:hypothetical protein [Polyangiaceae bacterium]